MTAAHGSITLNSCYASEDGAQRVHQQAVIGLRLGHHPGIRSVQQLLQLQRLLAPLLHRLSHLPVHQALKR